MICISLLECIIVVDDLGYEWYAKFSLLKCLREKKKKTFKVEKRSFQTVSLRNLNNLSMKCHSYAKLTTIDAFERKSVCHRLAALLIEVKVNYTSKIKPKQIANHLEH